MFSLVVVTYVISAVGVPIYLHYCGGELENINYVIKGSGCCGDEENETSKTDDGCCKDENVYLKNNTDFTIKHSDFELTKATSQIFFIALPFSFLTPETRTVNPVLYFQPDPVLQQQREVSTSVLRI